MKNFDQIIATSIKALLLAAIAFFSYQMFRINIYPYLVPPFRVDIDFLLTKQHIIHLNYYRWAFYIHITTSIITLLSGLTQFSNTVLTRYPSLHRKVGKIYVATVLLLAAPSGLVLSFYANGGFWSILGFVLMSFGWWTTTYLAYQAIRQRKVRTHGAWMLRSYALSCSAITLRLMQQYLFGYWRLIDDYELAYLVAGWGGWITNLIIAETMLYLGILNRYFRP